MGITVSDDEGLRLGPSPEEDTRHVLQRLTQDTLGTHAFVLLQRRIICSTFIAS
jgi:hypothetical protein